MTNQTPQLSVVPLPATAADLVRTKVSARTLNDRVEELYLRLYDNPQFHQLLDAVYREQTIHGSIACDDHEAARMILDLAREVGSPVQSEKIATVMKSLNWVLRHYNTARKQRRNTIGGAISPPTAE